VQKLAKTVAVGVSCINEACTAMTGASVRVPRVGATKARTYKLDTIRTQIAKGQKATIKLTLPAPAIAATRRALRAGKRVVVTVKLTATDAVGNKRVLSRGVRLRR